jgi:GYF domain 2
MVLLLERDIMDQTTQLEATLGSSIMNYFYADANNQPQGPYDLAQLEQLRANGTLTDATPVVSENGKEWKPLAHILAVAKLPPLPPVLDGLNQNKPDDQILFDGRDDYRIGSVILTNKKITSDHTTTSLRGLRSVKFVDKPQFPITRFIHFDVGYGLMLLALLALLVGGWSNAVVVGIIATVVHFSTKRKAMCRLWELVIQTDSETKTVLKLKYLWGHDPPCDVEAEAKFKQVEQLLTDLVGKV